MWDPIRVSCIGILCLSSSLVSFGQTSAQLKTSDTELVLEAGLAAPQLVSLSAPHQHKWENRGSETLIPFIEISDKEVPVKWRFNRNANLECHQPCIDLLR
jgi:hypothetical protein